MGLERIQPLPFGDIPKTNRLVDSDGSERLSIYAKSEMMDRIRMTDEDM